VQGAIGLNPNRLVKIVKKRGKGCSGESADGMMRKTINRRSTKKGGDIHSSNWAVVNGK